jgi:nucleoside-diphosphate-sugar epimerase
MKVLIIGGTGTISSAVTRRCVDKGYDVTLLNRGNRGSVNGTHSITADIHDADAVRDAIGDEHFDTVAEFIGFDPEHIQSDIKIFEGRTDQYIYISSASAYQKPVLDYPITEETPLINPYWEYSQKKAECEKILMDAYRKDGFPVTIVRPSHTYDEKHVPVAVHGANGCWQVIQRIIDGKSVIIPGDGTSLWTTTYNTDFAKGYCGLIGNKDTIGEAYHITSDEVMSWNHIYEVIADAAGTKLRPVHVLTDTLAELGKKYDLRGSLLGDKSNSVLFDNSKIKAVSPEFICTVSMKEGITRAVRYMIGHEECHAADPEFDAWCDEVIRS